ncbi:uncharacterized protein LOC105192254 isoform X2 [Harpegnathos saltator]|nr:uncharacterized protein LOC105192254 isoform X2 [Harpegnathos saltator]XP_025159401.1 uncharacterized protein LOC105192254 isoform X2 [Harpegnathos saltator]
MCADWTTDLQESIQAMTRGIDEQVQRIVQQAHNDARQSIYSSVKPALEQVRRTVQNLPRDEHGRLISNTGNTILVNNGNGVSRSITSGHTPDGEPFVRDIVEWYEGNMLYHNETAYNPRTKSMQTTCWKLDFATSGAKPDDC